MRPRDKLPQTIQKQAASAGVLANRMPIPDVWSICTPKVPAAKAADAVARSRRAKRITTLRGEYSMATQTHKRDNRVFHYCDMRIQDVRVRASKEIERRTVGLILGRGSALRPFTVNPAVLLVEPAVNIPRITCRGWGRTSQLYCRRPWVTFVSLKNPHERLQRRAVKMVGPHSRTACGSKRCLDS